MYLTFTTYAKSHRVRPPLHQFFIGREKKGGGEATMNVDHEVNLLVEEIHRLGSKNADGKLSVKFGVLFRDDKCANLFEALVGTLKAAKRRKIVTYPGELLLQGVHDDVDIILLQD
ncbi:Costars Family Protein Abracl [Manis pentadactyla]|nr:Costars Family Protein Abracl [Manis pentadactyla]